MDNNNKIAPPITIINPFNKHQPQLLIKYNLNATELLFWKVFRNKSIFNEIFSKFKLKRLKGYYDLQCTTQFLNNYSNSINIIIDNIKCNNNYFHHQIINNKDDIQNIIISIKQDNQETRSFYNLLFSTYSTTTTTTTSESKTTTTTNINFNNINEFIKSMIYNSNAVALDQFIKYFKIDKQVVKECLKSLRLRNLKSNCIDDKINILKYLFENDYVTLSSSSNNNNNENNNNKTTTTTTTTGITLNWLISTLFTGIHTIDKYLQVELKYIFKCFNVLVSIHQKFKEDSVVFFDKIEIRDKLDKLLLELNEITASTDGPDGVIDIYNINQYFTNDQLDTGLMEYIDSIHSNTEETTSLILISKHKEIVYKMFEFIILFDTIESNQLGAAQFFLKDKEYLYNLIKLNSGKIKGKGDYFKDLFECTFRYSKSDRLELVSSIFEPSYYDGSCKFKTANTTDSSSSVASISRVPKFEAYTFNIVQSNDLEIIDLYFKKILNFRISSNNNMDLYVIGFYQDYINNEQVLEYYISNYESLQIGGEIKVSKLEQHLIEPFEQLMKNSAGKIINIGDDEEINLTILKRIIKNPSMYSGNIGIDQIFNMISCGLYYENFNEELLFILSNIQLKQTLNINGIKDHNLRINKGQSLPSNSIIKFLFQNISNNSISKVLNKIDFNNYSSYSNELEFTTTTIATTTTEQTFNNNGVSVDDSEGGVQYEYESFIISKPTSITFSISLVNLLLCLYYLDRGNDILYLINTVPKILESDAIYSSYNYLACSLYEVLSTHYLQLFINYFIDNLNEITIKHLYKCLCVASKKGNLTLFKLLISTQNYYCDYLFKIKTESNNQSLFNSQSLLELVKISTNLNLKNLLLKYINFSENHLELLK